MDMPCWMRGLRPEAKAVVDVFSDCSTGIHRGEGKGFVTCVTHSRVGCTEPEVLRFAPQLVLILVSLGGLAAFRHSNFRSSRFRRRASKTYVILWSIVCSLSTIIHRACSRERPRVLVFILDIMAQAFRIR